VRRVPIPPQLVQLLRQHVDQYGTGPAEQLFLTSFCGTWPHRRSAKGDSVRAAQRVFRLVVMGTPSRTHLRSRLRSL
jgi:hypothetical protein